MILLFTHYYKTEREQMTDMVSKLSFNNFHYSSDSGVGTLLSLA